MSDLNCISVTGRLTRDATVKSIKDGLNLLTFDIANNIGYGDREKTNFYTVNMWGEKGIKLCQYLVKGSRVAVSGEESLNVWTTQTGETKTSRIITTNNITLLGGGSREGKQEEYPGDEGQQEFTF